mmetsp:Transcript_28311/g.27240  ORF Transcript_28311/g.27240 Transcript_28311/m.27240 type:complete len:116 (+) Transcript_28311:295-642(+)
MINEAREAVFMKLGGPLDYEEFREDLRQIAAEKEHLLREFKTQQLWTPEFGEKKVIGKVDYDFSVPHSIFSKDVIFGKEDEKEPKVSFQKPNYYQNIKSEPKYMIDFDLESLNQK